MPMTTTPTPTTPTTVEAWMIVISELEGKRQAARDRLTALRQRKSEISLQAALGDDAAKKELKDINGHLVKATVEGEDWDAAIAKAEAGRRQAEQTAAAEAEQARRQKISDEMGDYMTEVRAIDTSMRKLAEHFTAARSHLDVAAGLMQGGERNPLSQLYSKFGATLAAANFGLDKYLELGPTSADRIHRQPLTAFTAAFTQGSKE